MRIDKGRVRTMVIDVTEENIDDVREQIAAVDQAQEVCPGCQTWPIYYEGQQRGQITVWPDGRVRMCYGGDSVYGELFRWGDDPAPYIMIDDSGEIFDLNGQLVPDED